jgi:AraC-like DNA-binding protein
VTAPATGLPPHQYVIARRVERAKGLLQGGGELSLSLVAACAGFSDQSVFCRHFKRIVGVTPGRFRTPARSESVSDVTSLGSSIQRGA